jgi:hypothetical protein
VRRCAIRHAAAETRFPSTTRLPHGEILGSAMSEESVEVVRQSTPPSKPPGCGSRALTSGASSASLAGREILRGRCRRRTSKSCGGPTWRSPGEMRRCSVTWPRQISQWTSRGRLVDPFVLGRDEVLAFFSGQSPSETWEGWPTYEPRELIDAGDFVVATSARTEQRPSKPPGCRSRGCRRRTSPRKAGSNAGTSAFPRRMRSHR